MEGVIFYSAERIGKGGVPFTQLKFRTMTREADKEFYNFTEQNGRKWYNTPENDSRVTNLGKILRPWHLDEIPQLYNVLIGDMSLVGIRPRPASEWSLFPEEHVERVLNYKPGLFGIEYYYKDLITTQDVIDAHIDYLDQKDHKPKSTDLKYFRGVIKNRYIDHLIIERMLRLEGKDLSDLINYFIVRKQEPPKTKHYSSSSSVYSLQKNQLEEQSDLEIY
ncbi:sugar transferase [Candidatus Woesearchaeota archaeon]|nr:sugar transferase [Candidatus Woesearchaeota archaeon]